MSRRSSSKKFPFRLLLVFMIIAGLILLLFAAERVFNFDIPNPFYRVNRVQSSTAILDDIRDTARLNTVELVYKTVFPYDLIPEDTDWPVLFRRFRSGGSLSAEELELLAIFGIAADAGIDLSSKEHQFAVITARLTAGYDFAGTPFEDPEKYREDTADFILYDEEKDSLYIRLPEAKITEIKVDDEDSSSYSYPDMKVSPEQWRVLSGIITEHIKSEARKRRLTELAEERGKDVIKKMFSASGYKNIIFTDQIR